MRFAGIQLVLLAAAAQLVCGRITTSSIRGDGRNKILLARPFGFGQDGHLEFDVSAIEVYTKPAEKQAEPAYDGFRFYVAPVEVDGVAEDPSFDTRSECTGAPQQNWSQLLAFDTDDAQAVIKDKKKLVTVSRELSNGVYNFFFVSCDPSVLVSFNIETRMYNQRPNEKKSYLSVGELAMPTMYLVFCLLFGLGLGMYSYAICTNKNAHHIHILMIVLGSFKVLTLLSQFGMYHYIAITGEPDGWNIAYYIFTFFRGVLLSMVLVLIGTGWSYMTPFLGASEKRIMMVVIPMQIIIEVSIIVLDEFTPAKRAWFTWRDLMHFLDIFCCCAVLLPIVWRIKHLREAAETDGKAERSMQQLLMFRQFYIMVVVYIYFTRIVVYLLESTLPYQMSWLSKAAEELGALTFFTLTALLFRPRSNSQYFQLISKEELEMSNF